MSHIIAAAQLRSLRERVFAEHHQQFAEKTLVAVEPLHQFLQIPVDLPRLLRCHVPALLRHIASDHRSPLATPDLFRLLDQGFRGVSTHPENSPEKYVHGASHLLCSEREFILQIGRSRV
jgi:hypothetical protein